MKQILLTSLLFLATSSTALAYEMYVSEPIKPYDIVPVVGDVESRQVHLGTLNNFPIMYEVEVDEPTTLTVNLRQQYKGSDKPLTLALMIVKQEASGRGVSEVARLNPDEEDWVVVKDSLAGLTFWNGEVVTETLDSGIYRIEVSSPNNIGKYSLNFGEQIKSDGYFENLSHVRTVHKFYGYSISRMLVSPLIYYPLGLIFLLFGLKKVIKYRKIIKQND